MREGGSSVHGTGLNPGNLSGVLPLALSGMSRSIERVTLQERADWSFYESTHITFDNMRFGRAPDEVTEEASDFLRFNSGIFQEEVALSARARVPASTRSPPWSSWSRPKTITTSSGSLLAGTVSGQRWHWRGPAGPAHAGGDRHAVDGGRRVPAHWPTPLDGWTLTLEGEPSIQAHLLTLMSYERPPAHAEHVRAASVATAMQAINTIPALCEAPPGCGPWPISHWCAAAPGSGSPHRRHDRAVAGGRWMNIR